MSRSPCAPPCTPILLRSNAFCSSDVRPNTPEDPGAICRLSTDTPEEDPAWEEEWRKENIREELQAYHELTAEGVPATHYPSEASLESLSEPRQQVGILKYWLWYDPDPQRLLRQQQQRWKEFRSHQDWRRWRYWKPE